MKLFDFDGTLVDSNGVWEEIDVRFLQRHFCIAKIRTIF